VSALVPGGQEVVVETEDGLCLGGWFMPARENRTGITVLVCNGNGGNRSFRAPLAAVLSAAGCSVLLFDYRGYGGNPGRPSEPGLLADARAARAYLAARSDVDPSRLVSFGESLGAAVAVALAVETPPLGLILKSPFTSLADIGQLHYPFLPIRLLLRERYPAILQIQRVDVPLLVLAGAEDRIVPAWQSRALYEAARQPKRFVLVAGADHNDLSLLAGDQAVGEMVRFVADTARAAGQSVGGYTSDIRVRRPGPRAARIEEDR
jgi:fermentation-respiration switch protein FrsA (DUF1100 family)